MGNGDFPPANPSGQPPGDDEKTTWIPPNRAAPGPQHGGARPPYPPPPQSPSGPAPSYQQSNYPQSNAGPAPLPPGQRPGWLKWLAVAAAVIAVIAVAVTLVITLRGGGSDDEGNDGQDSAAASGAGTEESSAPLITGSALDGWMPSSTAMSAHLGMGPTAKYFRSQTMVVLDYAAADGGKCGTVTSILELGAYRGSGYTDARRVSMNELEPDEKRYTQIARVGGVIFPTVEAAKAMFAKLGDLTQSCGGKTVNLNDPGDKTEMNWAVGMPSTDADGVITWVSAQQDTTNDWKCARAVALRNNAIVESAACKPGSSADQAVSLLRLVTDQMAKK